MLTHRIEIQVNNRKGGSDTVLSGGEIKLRHRILNALFGKEQRILVLVPADIVQSVAIREIPERNAADE